MNFAAGARGDFFEKFAHPRRIRQHQRRLFRGGVAGEIKIQIDRFLEFAKHMLRRLKFDNITTAKNSTASAISPPAPKPNLRQRLPFTYSAFFISRTKAVAANQKPIRAPKYTRSRKSITPLEIASKCVKKLNDAMASTMACGKTPRTNSSTRGNPASRNTNPTKAAVMNATT